MKAIQQNPRIIESEGCIVNILWVTDLSLILLNTSCEIPSVSKEVINNETQYVPLLCLSSRFMTYAPSFILGKLSLKKTPLNQFVLEILSNFDIA